MVARARHTAPRARSRRRGAARGRRNAAHMLCYASSANIKVLGIGGAGGNAINRMISSGVENVTFMAMNTDVQALERSFVDVENRVQLGQEATRGLGAGGNAEVGEMAAAESRSTIAAAVGDADLVFVAAGMGGGTGSGAAPTVARVAKEQGALTIGVVTLPFMFEGAKRSRQAREAAEALRQNVDTIITIPNDKLLSIVPEGTPLNDAFLYADDVLRQGVQGISDIITIPGLVNVDFADVKAVMQNAGSAMLGIGMSSGKDRAEEAAQAAISAPLIERQLQQATGIVYNVTGGPDMTLMEVNAASEAVASIASPDANVIFGAVVDEKYEGQINVTIIATGFEESTRPQRSASPTPSFF